MQDNPTNYTPQETKFLESFPEEYRANAEHLLNQTRTLAQRNQELTDKVMEQHQELIGVSNAWYNITHVLGLGEQKARGKKPTALQQFQKVTKVIKRISNNPEHFQQTFQPFTDHLQKYPPKQLAS